MSKPELSDDQAAELSDIFRQLGDPRRVRIVWSCLDHPVSAGDVARRLGVSESLASHDLRMLSASRLLRSERRGRQTFYAAAHARIGRLIHDMICHAQAADDDGDER